MNSPDFPIEKCARICYNTLDFGLRNVFQAGEKRMHSNIKDNLQTARENVKENLQNAKESVRENLQKSRENLQAARADVIAARKCENINDPIDTHIVDYVAMVFSKLFIALHIIPNVVTMLSGLSGVAGGVVLALNRGLGMDIVGVLLVFLSAVFDASDGQVARLTKHYSRLGRVLDGAADASVYLSIFVACVLRLWDRPVFGLDPLPHWLLIALAVVCFAYYVFQCQLPDYFKNLHMYMIDNSKGNELSRGKHVLAELRAARFGTFDHLVKLAYYLYTSAQERRAPRTQRLLDAVERKGKSDALSDAYYAVSRRLVKRTNLLTFNLRTLVMMACMLLHWELIGMLFVLVVLEPIRVVLLLRYEKLSRDLLPMVQ